MSLLMQEHEFLNYQYNILSRALNDYRIICITIATLPALVSQLCPCFW